MAEQFYRMNQNSAVSKSSDAGGTHLRSMLDLTMPWGPRHGWSLLEQWHCVLLSLSKHPVKLCSWLSGRLMPAQGHSDLRQQREKGLTQRDALRSPQQIPPPWSKLRQGLVQSHPLPPAPLAGQTPQSDSHWLVSTYKMRA